MFPKGGMGGMYKKAQKMQKKIFEKIFSNIYNYRCSYIFTPSFKIIKFRFF